MALAQSTVLCPISPEKWSVLEVKISMVAHDPVSTTPVPVSPMDSLMVPHVMPAAPPNAILASLFVLLAGIPMVAPCLKFVCQPTAQLLVWVVGNVLQFAQPFVPLEIFCVLVAKMLMGVPLQIFVATIKVPWATMEYNAQLFAHLVAIPINLPAQAV